MKLSALGSSADSFMHRKPRHDKPPNLKAEMTAALRPPWDSPFRDVKIRIGPEPYRDRDRRHYVETSDVRTNRSGFGSILTKAIFKDNQMFSCS